MQKVREKKVRGINPKSLSLRHREALSVAHTVECEPLNPSACRSKAGLKGKDFTAKESILLAGRSQQSDCSVGMPGGAG